MKQIKQYKTKPKISVNIPTRNNINTIPATLSSLWTQTNRDFEVIVLDSSSDDGTVEYCRNFSRDNPEIKLRIINIPGALLEARIVGAKESKADWVMFLDSDQILNINTVQNIIDRTEVINKKFDMMWLYERSFNNYDWVPRLYDADRIIVQEHYEENVVLPRVWRKSILLKAMESIPTSIFSFCYSHDHLIIFNEFLKYSQNDDEHLCRIGSMNAPAVWHMEPDNLIKIWKKQFNYGKTTRKLIAKQVYLPLINTRHSFRGFYFSTPWLSFKSLVLRIFRGVPYVFGLWF
jgi:glycosyltransferase involved in cell wall biosynthesis